ncbi:MAG TPA: ATP-binding protein [Thermoanaerobaculia bacterium]|nr:ATP-binding protein [Thermoanaerobaculia bacterium]
MNGAEVNVLLVDDQPNNLLALEAMLADLDVHCVTADSGTQALKRLLEKEFAVILLDVQMPGMDGFETANLIRSRDKSRLTPIIFVTALSRHESNVFHGYSVGAVDYLFKPIVPEILRSKVQVFVDLFRKSRELEKQAAEMGHLSRQNQLILDSAADGVVGVDLQRRATFINLSGARLLGDAPARLIGRDVHELIHPARLTACVPADCELKNALEGHGHRELHEDLFNKRDGARFPAEYSATPMRNEEGQPIGSVLTFRDVSERHAAATARDTERLYREAEAANKAKDDFLATLSHELRTPMTAILGWNEILAMGEIDDNTRREAVEAIRNSARIQKQLIDDMLDVSRIIMGKFGIDLRPETLPEIVDRAIDTVKHQAVEREIEITAQIDHSPVRVLADEFRLRQVIWNLLSNAIKFTGDSGSVEVRLEIADREACITVSDQGSGIDPGMLPHIFDRLVQTEDGKSKGGLGLGLAIARHIVELHAGRIEAHSEGLGKGASFTVTLPIWVEEPAQDSPEAGSPQKQARTS